MDVTLNEVTFALPCKTFFVDYSVSKKRTLPVVKEFVIRYIYTLESVAAGTLSSFFGFNPNELLNVLEDLKEESLIVWQEDEVRLSRYALTRFEETRGDGVPRFFEVTDEFATVTFDLMSYRLITNQTEAYNSPNAIEVTLRDEAYMNPSAKANRAFNDQFGIFLEEQLRIDSLNDWVELYKINSVTPKYDRMLPLRIKLFVDTDKADGLCVEYADDWLIDWDKTGGILGEIQKNLSEGSVTVRSSARDIEAFCDATGDSALRRFIRGGAVDIDSLLISISDGSDFTDAKTRRIVGNLYLEENIRLFNTLLDDAIGQDNKIQSQGAIWSVDPDRKMWGRTSDFAYFTKRVGARFDERFKPKAISLCLAAPSHLSARSYRNQYRRAEVEFQGVNHTFGGPQTELFFVPGVILAAIFHGADDRFGNQSIPIGILTTDSKRVDWVANGFAAWIGNVQNRNKYFESAKDSEETIFNTITKKILGMS